MPRNSSFVIICASQAYGAGQEELPKHLRSKNVSTSHLEQAPENSEEFPLLKTSPQYHNPTGQLLQPPALLVVPHKREGNLREIPVGQLRVRRQSHENQQGRSSAAAGGILLTTVPRAEGEAVGRTTPRPGWKEKFPDS